MSAFDPKRTSATSTVSSKNPLGSRAHTIKFIRVRAAALWRLLPAELDFATEVAYVGANNLNPSPSGEDAETANLAMSDHLCAKAHGSTDIRAHSVSFSLIRSI